MMLHRLKIGYKVILLVVVLVTLSVLLESFISYQRNKSTLFDDNVNKLEIIQKVYDERVESYFEKVQSQLQLLSSNQQYEHLLDSIMFYSAEADLETGIDRETKSQELRALMKNDIFSALQKNNAFEDIMILNHEGVIVYQHNEKKSEIGKEFHNIDNKPVDIHKPSFFVNHPVLEGKNFFVYVVFPTEYIDKALKANIICKINVVDVLKDVRLDDLVGIKSSISIQAFKIYKRELKKIGEYSRKHDFEDYRMVDVSQSDIRMASSKEDWKNKQTVIKDYKDEYGLSTLALFTHNDLLGMGMLAKIDHKELFVQLSDYNIITIIIGFIIVVISFMLSLLFTKLLTVPMLKLKKVLGLISNGVLPKELQTPLKDEVGEMILIVNKIVNSLKKTAAFAHKIGEGDFDTEYRPLSNKDILGHALVNMRESLQKADKKDELRNWIVTGVAEIGEILRSNDTLVTLGDEILNYLCQRINAVQGAFYTVKDESQDDLYQMLEMKSSFAYGKKKYIKGEYKFAEGLVGQAAIEKDTILRTEIPDDYMYVTSGILGDQKPKCVLIVPLITNERVFGVIELSGFIRFSPGEVQFIEEVSLIIARTIFNIKVNERTRNLLEESQRMSSELQVHQKELQQNAIEMETTQEQLKETNTKLEIQVRNVNNAQKRMHTLLENASEVITIYEEDGNVRYVSPSVERILGYKQEELIGINDIKYVDEKEQPAVKEMFSQLIGNNEEQVTIQMSYYRKTGDKIWLEATGKNMINDPAINGIVVNSRDITERLRAEREERKRGQMQALSENSPDLITRLSANGTFFYINPAIEKLTGNNPIELINTKLKNSNISDKVKESWTEIVNEVLATNGTVDREIDFPSAIGERIMSVSAIPEYGFENPEEIETVLVVSHDVTEQKKIEHEIIMKNKKINDSINYAERIQEAILPDSVLMNKTFNSSFIYYRPRDVVSGDFPWFMQKGDDIFIGAVDCTGHGVPGALISIVGFFLLNDIVGSQDVSVPGEILDNLDRLVTSTFKQDLESSKIKDGMDIAFCKVNTKKRTVEYAGAHRPLYIIKADGEFDEIKGNKFPIGGGSAYNNKTDFTNYELQLDEGDTIFFFSDGFPDQFGGPNNRKYGPKRIKSTLMDNRHLEMDKMLEVVDKELMGWKGDVKQTDDILMIGIRF